MISDRYVSSWQDHIETYRARRGVPGANNNEEISKKISAINQWFLDGIRGFGKDDNKSKKHPPFFPLDLKVSSRSDVATLVGSLYFALDSDYRTMLHEALVRALIEVVESPNYSAELIVLTIDCCRACRCYDALGSLLQLSRAGEFDSAPDIVLYAICQLAESLSHPGTESVKLPKNSTKKLTYVTGMASALLPRKPRFAPYIIYVLMNSISVPKLFGKYRVIKECRNIFDKYYPYLLEICDKVTGELDTEWKRIFNSRLDEIFALAGVSRDQKFEFWVNYPILGSFVGGTDRENNELDRIQSEDLLKRKFHEHSPFPKLAPSENRATR